MTREAFIRKYLGNTDYQYTDHDIDSMREDLDKVILFAGKDKMGSVNSKWKVGDVVRILDNFSCHNFEINDNVKLLRYDFEDEVWEAQGINERWWISEKEAELV